MTTASTPPAPRGSLAVAVLSTVVEWYDFTLFLYMATVLSRVFFGGGESLTTILGGFAVAYLMRPLGAILFGHFGDRRGRRWTMLVSMAVMSLTMLVTGLLPTAAQIGPTAGWLLLLMRCVTGLAVGGEYTGVVAYLVESAPAARRGLMTSLAAASSEVGALLAAGLSAITVSMLSPAELDGWGWRIPFFFGAGLALLVWLARARMAETPEFEQQRASGTVHAQPLRHALRHNRRGIARGFAISALGSISYYVGITYVPAYLSSVRTLEEGRALWLSTIAALVVILVTPFFGAMSDKAGRRPTLLLLCGLAALLPAAMFAWMAGGSFAQAVFGAAVLAAVAGGVSAVGAVTTAEQLSGESRLSGLALGATTATAVFGGLTPFVAQTLIEATGSALVPGIMIAIVAIAVLPVFVTLPETAPARA